MRVRFSPAALFFLKRLRHNQVLVVFTGGKFKKIGILGGMGPEATAELYLKIIRIFQGLGAKYDDDFPEIIICSLPLPDVVKNPSRKDGIRRMLVEGVVNLEKTGADFIAIPCNTVTFFIEDMRKAVSIPIINIVEETAQEIKRLKLFKVGLLATETAIGTGIFERALKSVDIIKPTPTEQAKITEVIFNILEGKKQMQDKITLRKLIENFKAKGAEKIILGCTELPLLVGGSKDVIDTLNILAKAAAERAIDKVLDSRVISYSNIDKYIKTKTIVGGN